VPVKSGIRQDGILSPVLFNIYVDSLILGLKFSGLGCHIQNLYVECLAYADDVLLLFGSVCLLQKMLNICSDCADELNVRSNVKKSCLLNIGNTFNKKLENLQLNGLDICWFDKIKYLGMQIVSGKSLKVDVLTRIRKFYASANALFCSSKYVCELTRLCLCESFVLPVFTYGC